MQEEEIQALQKKIDSLKNQFNSDAATNNDSESNIEVEILKKENEKLKMHIEILKKVSTLVLTNLLLVYKLVYVRESNLHLKK